VQVIAGYDLISARPPQRRLPDRALKPWDERPARTCMPRPSSQVARVTRGLPEAIVVPFNRRRCQVRCGIGFSMMLQARGGQTAEELAAVPDSS
jgi:hypothetical protein